MQVFGSVCARARCGETRKQTLEEIIQLAVEIAREGREGRKIGTLFVVGDVEQVLDRSRPLLLDPLYGHSSELLHVARPDLRETVKELAQLDGAFLVADDGTFVSAGRFVEVDLGLPATSFRGSARVTRLPRRSAERPARSPWLSRRARSSVCSRAARCGRRSSPSCS